MTERWGDPQDFSDDIESWLRNPENMHRFQSALEGDGEALDWLPHWVACGVYQMRAKMRFIEAKRSLRP